MAPDLLVALKSYGLRGRCLLDVGCGTGKSFMPMLVRGWEVTGCDISPSMAGLAREKVGDAARLEVADMLALPRFGRQPLDETIHTQAIYVARRLQEQKAATRS